MFYLSHTLPRIEQTTFLSDINPERVWSHLTYPARSSIGCPKFRSKEHRETQIHKRKLIAKTNKKERCRMDFLMFTEVRDMMVAAQVTCTTNRTVLLQHYTHAVNQV